MKKVKEEKFMQLKKNDELNVEIDDLGTEGEGIAHVNGYVLFIKDAIPGDFVKTKIMKTKKSYGYGRLIDILRSSNDRVKPECLAARACGGCQIQHMAYSSQLAFKQSKIENCLIRIGKFTDDFVKSVMEPVMGMENPYYYRNKAQFPVGLDKQGNLIAGFYANRTHSIIPVTNCMIQAQGTEKILNIILDYMAEYKVTPYEEASHKGLVRHILIRTGYQTGQWMVCLVLNGTALPFEEKLTEELLKVSGMTAICVNVNQEKTNVILGSQIRIIWGKNYIEDYIGSVKFQISPLSFFQVNPVQTQKLYAAVMEFSGLTGEEIVWDLYCGIGTISLFLAQKAKMVYGVEIIPEAIEDANRNKQINGITNAAFFVGAAEEVLPAKYEESKGSIGADVVVLDPPRKGCDQVLLDTILAISPEKIVYVSCDPATLARDLKILAEGGYELKRVRGCDMFGHTAHVETIVLIQRADT